MWTRDLRRWSLTALASETMALLQGLAQNVLGGDGSRKEPWRRSCDVGSVERFGWVLGSGIPSEPLPTVIDVVAGVLLCSG